MILMRTFVSRGWEDEEELLWEEEKGEGRSARREAKDSLR